MAAPIIGVIILIAVLFFSFSERTRKQKMKLGFPPKSAQVSPPLSDFLASASPPVESTADVEAPVFLDGEPSVAMPGDDDIASIDETNLNLDLLSPLLETEASMMNPSQSPRGQKAGLAARLGNRPQPAPAPPKPETQQESPNPVTPGMAAKPAGEPVSASDVAEPVELLCLLRDPQSGQLIVEIAGRRYTKLAEIADKEIGQYILRLAAHLLAFTSGMIATDAGLKTLPAPKVGETPMPLAAPGPIPPRASPPAATVSAPQPPSDVEAAFLASLRAQPTVPVQPPKQERKGLFGRPKPDEVETLLLPALNLAGQINEIAQARLRYSPLAATTQLEITSDPGGGILINVNGSFYHGPDDIPQAEVKELIKASIKEWERS
jgi:hypothetical protein